MYLSIYIVNYYRQQLIPQYLKWNTEKKETPSFPLLQLENKTEYCLLFMMIINGSAHDAGGGLAAVCRTSH